MDTVEQTETKEAYHPEDHPWLEITGDGIDEEIRYSLDEIRIA